ncbi:U-box domain-containing protein 33-like [Hordeum vulgare subsp. vulgare]|uniref:RING-type E3 ubiquitin transferase n=1 Tax=Hordeum vulgare subsp. vulgare TaxID=112509 RepID=A0A8I6XSA5_HORVV|nr:U-box domain-containing protein 33-like [Hordeum vulgare subsp. vulgare]
MAGAGGVGRSGEDEDGEGERGGGAAEVQVYCAVGKEAGREWRANLRWVLANFPRSRHRLVLAHVHRPPHRINMMGAWVPVSQLAEHEVAAYSKLEEDRASKALDVLIDICASQRVQARKVVVSGDDAARGLVQLVDDHAVAELVMGAAADRGYTRKLRTPKSKKAVTVQRKANPSCRIWFVCKGNLICTREVSEELNRGEPSTASTSPRSVASDYSRSKSSPPRLTLHGDCDGDGELFGLQHDSRDPMMAASLRRTPSRDDSDNAEDHSVEDFGHEGAAEGGSSAVVHSLQDVDEDPPTPSHDGSEEEAGDMEDALYEKLKDAITEAGSLRHEAYEETRRRQKADRDLADASRMAREAESSYHGEARRRKEMEESLTRERAAMEQERRELDAILEKIRAVDDRSAELELQITDSGRVMSELDVRMSESCSVLDALRRGRRGEDPAADEESMPAVDGGNQDVSFLRLGLSELEEATDRFHESAMIGGAGAGSRGRVYRGSLRGMSVAVKMICPDVAVDEARFGRAVDAIARARHPHIVSLVGACPEARAVVHELVPGGSLEDRLAGKAPPLPWHARCGVAYRTCSALAYLHSTATVHGDVRPANILLDDERCSSSKLAGLGMPGLVVPPQLPSGVALAYVDPRYLATGELTPQCDVHALGVVLLRLVTGMPAFAAKKAAQKAAEGSTPWHEVVDASAGGWPMERATEVALLGLKCCDAVETGGPRRAGELLDEALGVLEAATNATPGRTWSSLSASTASDSGGAPSYFLCPILKEVMRDPQIAGDGFTYEAGAMKEWLGSGHDTSPMTNLKLPTDELMPNHALRAAIQEWRHTRPSTFHRHL